MYVQYELLRDALFEGIKWDTSVDEQLLRTRGQVLKAASFTSDDLGNTFKTRVRLAELVRLICDEMTVTFDNTFVACFQTSRTLVS